MSKDTYQSNTQGYNSSAASVVIDFTDEIYHTYVMPETMTWSTEKTSVAATLIARLPRLFSNLFLSPLEKIP